MHITLPPEAQAIIDREIDAGHWDTAEQVIVAALLRFGLADIPHVPDELLVSAREQADRNEGRPFTEEVMRELLNRARSHAHQRRSA